MRRRPALVVAAALAAVGVLVPAASGALGRAPRTARPWAPQKGIAVSMTLANQVSDARAMQIGQELFSMIHTKLHANAVSFNFPFWQAGSDSNDPKSAPMTPTPGRLMMLTELAQRDGLAVQYRPFLYEGNLVKQSRPSITPTDPSLWFANYWAFLKPYLATASEDGAASFSVALEFTSLLPYVNFRCGTCLSSWERLVAEAKAVYPGPLFYSQQHVPQETIPLTERGYDAYQPICPSTPTQTVVKVSACHVTSPHQISVATFTRGFVHNLEMAGMQSTPADLTIEELGIPAVAGAYLQPNWFHYAPGVKVDRPVQTDWFAGACNAFRALHVAGIYFWSIDFDTFTPTERATDPYNWLGTPSATAIASCFARTP